MKVVRKKGIKKLKITHNWKLLLIILGLIIFLGFVITSIVKNNKVEDIVDEDSCFIDTDCVASRGCHPTECINQKNYVEPSEKLFCSQVCSGPLDCGAGSCGCVNNKCVVVPA